MRIESRKLLTNLKHNYTFVLLGVFVLGILLLLTFIKFGRFTIEQLPNTGEILPFQYPDAWPMVGANPQRTSWTSAEAPGQLYFSWIKRIEPYVSYVAQPIAVDEKIFVSTSKGLYAFSADTGEQLWVFGTEMPLGNSPTYSDGVLYVGGMDRRLYALDADNKQLLWTFTADGGFDTNPLVINNVVYLGNRDGKFYAVSATNGQLVWQYDVGYPILQSAAYNDGKVFFGAMNSKAYALNTDNGSLAWSLLLPGAGWNAHWPVIYEDKVIFTRAMLARLTNKSVDVNGNISGEFSGDTTLSAECVYLFHLPSTDSVCDSTDNSNLPAGQIGAVSYTWAPGTVTIDLSNNPLKPGFTVPNFYDEDYKREARAVFVIDQATGLEEEFDTDGDNKIDAPPIFRTASDAQTFYPPVLSDYDDVLYFRNPIWESTTFSGSMPVGWKYGTAIVSWPMRSNAGGSPDLPMDEYTGFSGGGKYLYYSLMDRNIGGMDLSQPSNSTASINDLRQWRYVQGSDDYPDYPAHLSQAVKYFWQPGKTASDGGFYYGHGWSMGPTIYDQKVYVLRSNALIAYSAVNNSDPIIDTIAEISAPEVTGTTLTDTQLRQRLEQEVQEIIDLNEHLHPYYFNTGRFDAFSNSTFGDHLNDYWSNPGEIVYTLSAAYPYLNATLKQQVATYLANEMTTYPLHQTAYVGWEGTGEFRQPYLWPSEMYANMPHVVKESNTDFTLWNKPPQNVYAMYKYAESGMGNASTLLTQANTMIQSTINLNDQTLLAYPHVLNAYISGYVGITELAKLTNGGVLPSSYMTHKNELDRLKALRLNNFEITPTNTFTGTNNVYFNTLINTFNYMYMTPELGTYLNSNNPSLMQQAFAHNEEKVPLWMMAHNKEVQGESGITPYQQTWGMFQAKAYLLKASQQELSKYIDSPIVEVGDLYYMQNLIAALEAGGEIEPSITPGGVTSTPSSMPSHTPVVTVTSVVPSSTPTPSNTPRTATATPTVAATNTPVPTNTPINTPTVTPSSTPTPTSTPTVTPTKTPTPTPTPSPAPSNTLVPSATPSGTSLPTQAPTVTTLPASCSLNSIQTSKQTAIQGEVISINVLTSNCEGQTVEIEIYEQDLTEDILSDVTASPALTTVTAGTALSSWIAEWKCEATLLAGACIWGNPEYYVKATLVNTGATIKSALIPVVPDSGQPKIIPIKTTAANQVFVVMSSSLTNSTIYYTTDGSEPDTNSLIYQGVIVAAENTTIKAIASDGKTVSESNELTTDSTITTSSEANICGPIDEYNEKGEKQSDGKLTYQDFIGFSQRYQQGCADKYAYFGTCGGRDHDESGKVDFNDFIFMSDKYQESSCVNQLILLPQTGGEADKYKVWLMLEVILGLLSISWTLVIVKGKQLEQGSHSA